MALKIYNTLTRKKQIFKSLRSKRVGLYTCGPTVYNFAHIGNLRTYIFEDGLSLRGTFIIDPEGVLKAYEIHENSIGRSIEELIRKLQAAKFVSENKGQVCPINWKPGAKTLKPGLDLVGKI